MNRSTDAPLGYGTAFGTIMAIVAGVAGIWAGIEGKNVETCAAAAVALVATFETLNGRFSQAVARIRQGVVKATPLIDEAQERMATRHEQDRVAGQSTIASVTDPPTPKE